MPAAETARLLAELKLEDKFSKTADAAIKKTGALEGSFKNIGKTASGGLGTAAKSLAGIAAGVGIAAGLKTAISEASDLSETVSKVGVVFGKEAAKVITFGDTAAKSLGLSQNAALGAAATFGNLFVAMQLPEKKSADMSLALVKLASDLASFNNLDPTEVLEKLRAGLTGEAEPLKSLGVNINETIIKQKALDLGLVKTRVDTTALTKAQLSLITAQKAATEAVKRYGKDSLQAQKAQNNVEVLQKRIAKLMAGEVPDSLDAATKAQAAYALIFEQTKKAQGDFARTSDGLANQQRIFKANISNTAATIGTALLPKVADLTTRINDFVTKNQPKIAELAAQLPVVFDKAVEFGSKVPWEQVGKGLETAAGFAGDLINAFATAPPEVQATLLALAGLNKLSGGAITDIVSELGKGLIKGVLGITAAVVNVTAATVKGGGGGGGGGGTDIVEDITKRPGLLASLGFIAAGVGLGFQNAQNTSNIFKTLIDGLGEKVPDAFKATGNPLEDVPKLLDVLSGKADKEIEEIRQSRLAAGIQAALQRDQTRLLAAGLRPQITVQNNVSITSRDVTGAVTRDGLVSTGISYTYNPRTTG